MGLKSSKIGYGMLSTQRVDVSTCSTYHLLLGWCFCKFLDGALPKKTTKGPHSVCNLRVVYHLFSGGGWSTKLQACRRLRLCHDLCWAVWRGGLPLGEMMTWRVNSWIFCTGGTEKLTKTFWPTNQVSKNYFKSDSTWKTILEKDEKDLTFEDLRVSRLVKSYFSPDGVVSFRLKIHQGCQRLLILGGWARTSWMLQFFRAIQIFRKGKFFSRDLVIQLQ